MQAERLDRWLALFERDLSVTMVMALLAELS